jgi:fumarate reductase subunit C
MTIANPAIVLYFAFKPKPPKMKKTIVGALVGGIILFLWQFLSWTILDLHRPANEYTPKQDSIMSVLKTNLTADGGYYMPGLPKTATMDDHKKMMQTMDGQPWARVEFHKSWHANMGMNMARGLIVNILIVLLLCYVITKLNNNSFGRTFIATLGTGIIVFLNSAYTQHIWFESFDLMAFMTDYLVSWGVCGLWLGWWMNRK